MTQISAATTKTATLPEVLWKGEEYMPRSRQVAGGKGANRKRENLEECINREPFSTSGSLSFRQLHSVSPFSVFFAFFFWFWLGLLLTVARTPTTTLFH